MARRTVQHAGIRYTIADDDPAAIDLLPWAVLRTRVVDELTLAAPHVAIALTSTLRGARPRVADGGVCGLVARPRDVAPALVTPNGFTAQVTAAGYLPRDLTPAIELARRTLNTTAAAGVSTLDIVPGDPAPRAQFTPGRGVVLERPAAADEEQFTTVAVTAVPPPATDAPLAEPVGALRPGGSHVSGLPMALPDQPLHRDAMLRLRGRVQLRTGPTAIVPAIGARVGILGIWWNYPSSVTGVPLAPDVCSVEPTLRLAHPAGATVHTCALNPLGAPRVLRHATPLESGEVVVAPNNLLNPLGGDLLQVGDPLTGDDEVIVTDGFDATADPAAAVRVRLRTPAGRLHRAGEPVQVVQAVAVAPVAAVSRESLPGDPVLFAPGLTLLPTISTIIVEHLTPRAVFYRATQVPSTPDGIVFNHQILPDATGRFEWPPLARIAQIRVVASLPPHAPVQFDAALDYGGDAPLAIVLT
jgi:hypothetical protein